MATDPGSIRICENWLEGIALLCATGKERLTAAKKKALATMLCELFPSGAFTTASAGAAVTGSEFFPAFDVLQQRVGEWWQRNRPGAGRSVVEGNLDGLDVMDRSWVRYWRTREAENFAAIHSSPGGRQHVASLIRKQSPAAWAHITGLSEPAEPERVVTGGAAAAAQVAASQAALSLALPREPRAHDVADQLAALPARAPAAPVGGQMPAEALAAARAANPIMQQSLAAAAEGPGFGPVP